MATLRPYTGYAPHSGAAAAASYIPSQPYYAPNQQYSETNRQLPHNQSAAYSHQSGAYPQYGPPSGYQGYYNGDGGGGYNQQQQQYSPAGVMQMQAPTHTLLDWFNAVDTDRSGRIDASELSRALRKGGINLSVLGAVKIISMFDSNHSGQINFEEFQALHPFIQKMTLTFKSRDKSGNGRIEMSELRATLLDSGYSIDNATFGILMAKFDSEKRNTLGFEDYVQLIVFLHNVKETFQFYDRNKSGKVMFTPDSFLEASISVRE